MIELNSINKIEINTPDVLISLLVDLKHLITLGLLREIDNYSVYSISINELDPNGEMPDYFEIAFYSPIYQKQYLLSIETFHGMGGYFQLLEK